MLQNQVELPQKDILNTQILGEEDQNKENLSTELIERHEIEGTPFRRIYVQEKNQHFIAFGQYRISDIYDNQGDAEMALQTDMWNILINTTALLISVEMERSKNEVVDKLMNPSEKIKAE